MCERCRIHPAEIPWSGERLCWSCADRQLGQVADDLPWFTPFTVPNRPAATAADLKRELCRRIWGREEVVSA